MIKSVPFNLDHGTMDINRERSVIERLGRRSSHGDEAFDRPKAIYMECLMCIEVGTLSKDPGMIGMLAA